MKNKKTMKQAAALLLTIAAVAVPVVPSAQPLSASAISNADVLGISVSGPGVSQHHSNPGGVLTTPPSDGKGPGAPAPPQLEGGARSPR